MVHIEKESPNIYSNKLAIKKRRHELVNQRWNRNKSQLLADKEGFLLSDEHWVVLIYLRKHYLEYGLPLFSRYLTYAMSLNFSSLGGTKYLRDLFPDGPITQGSRIANVPAPKDAYSGKYIY